MSISVLCSVRNGEEFLYEALSSVLRQTFKDICLIVVDDSSEDQTSQILKDLVSTDKRINVISNSHCLGLTRSLNKALATVATPWVARIDHDDVWHPEKLARQMEFLSNNPDIGFLGTAYREMDADGCNLRDSVLPVCQTDNEIRRALYRFNPFFHSSIMIDRKLVQGVGGYNERFLYAQDYELWVRLMNHTQAAILPEILCYRRMGEGNISVRKERAQRLNALKAKVLWARLNGFRIDLLGPLMRDLVVLMSPDSFKKVVRSRLRSVGR